MTALILAASLLAAPPNEVALEPVGKLAHPAIRETSGMVKSRKHAGIFWVHNDSGNPPALFAVRADGSLVREYALGVPNVDWEDIATDDEGRLFLGDIGNNNNLLPLRAVYRFPEPNPFAGGKASIAPDDASYYRFAKAGRFDAEGLFVDGKRVFLVAKTFDGRDAEVYEVPFAPAAPLFGPAVLKRVATLPGFTKPVTGASLSADGKRLAVCAVDGVGIYERGREDAWSLAKLGSFGNAGQVEAVAWNGDDLILASEGRDVYRLKSQAWRALRPPKRAAKPHDE